METVKVTLTALDFHRLNHMVMLLRSYNEAATEYPHLADLAKQMAARETPFNRLKDGSVEIDT